MLLANKVYKTVGLIFVFLTFSQFTSAQIKVNSLGKTAIGYVSPRNDYNLTIAGGDNESRGVYEYSAYFMGRSVFKQGVSISGGSYENFLYGSFYLNGKLLTSSDERLKKNFETIKNPIQQLKKIEGFTYEYKSYDELLSAQDIDGITKNYSVDTVYNEDGSYTLTDDRESRFTFPKGKQYGLKAQDVLTVFPDLVSYDSVDGVYAVDYEGFIPILIETAKKQYNQLKKQKKQIEDLTTLVSILLENRDSSTSSSRVNTSSDNGALLTDVATLKQNSPNPFNNETKIDCFIPKKVSTATIYIHDINGSQLKEIEVFERDNTKVVINGSSLKSGIYMYSLVCDGKLIDTKKMLLTK